MDALNDYADARAPVPPPASGVVADDPNQRQRFFVELAPGETTIVSWKTLVQEANNGVVDDDSSDEEEDLEDYIQAEKSRIKEYGSIFKRDTVRHKSGIKKSSISLNVRNKTMRKVIMDAALQKLQELKSAQHDLHRSLMSKNYEQEGFTNIKQRNNKGRNNLPDLNLLYAKYALVLIEIPPVSLSSADSSSTTSLSASWTSVFHETIVVSPGASSTKNRCLWLGSPATTPEAGGGTGAQASA